MLRRIAEFVSLLCRSADLIWLTYEFAAFYGNVLFNQHRYAEAAHQMELALQRDSSMYEVWELLLISLDAAGDSSGKALRYARRAAQLFPVHTLPHYMLAVRAVMDGRYDEALAETENAIKWGFSKGYLEGATHALQAEAYYRTGQYDKAWRAFERSIAAAPDDWPTLNNYAYYLSEQGIELEKAAAMSRRTVEAQPDNANSLDTCWGATARPCPTWRKPCASTPRARRCGSTLKPYATENNTKGWSD